MSQLVATAASGQIYVEYIDGVVIDTIGYTIANLQWNSQLLNTNNRITITDRSTEQPIWSWSDVPGADDTGNTFNGASTLATIQAAIITAFSTVGGGGGGGGNVVVTSSALPTGAATEATLAVAATALGLLDDVVSVVATPGTIPTKSLQVSGVDEVNGLQYPIPVAAHNAVSGANKVLVIGGLRNRQNISAIPIVGDNNQMYVAVEARSVQTYRNSNLTAAVQTVSANALMYGYQFYNTNATAVFVKVWGSNVLPVLGTTPPNLTIHVPANSQVTIPPGSRPFFRGGTNIYMACVTGFQDLNTTAPGTPIIANVFFNSDNYN